MATGIYLEGRNIKKLSEVGKSTEDKAFTGDRLDDSGFSEYSFKHCTFVNIGFKNAKIVKLEFINCIFIGCYFRKTNLSETKFTGCRFIDCMFPNIHIKCCSFDYSTFNNCFIPFHEIEYSLPGAPNLRKDLTRNLSTETAKLGHFSESSRYRKEELKAREKHLWAAFKGESRWYRDHYDYYRKLKSLFKFIISKLNGFFFGYGQYFFPLLRNFFSSAVVFWILFYVLRNQLINTETKLSPNGIETLFYSLHNLIPAGFEVKIQAAHSFARALAGLESLWGLVIAAFVASFIFRWSLNR